MAENFSCGLVLLAAGASTRMGRPKQLLPVRGKPLLRHVVESVLTEPVSPVIVVLGANAPEIAPCLDGLRVHVVVNAGWGEGMGSSLRIGLEALITSTPTVGGIIVALADQPDLPTGHLAALIERQRATGRSIVASESEGVHGPPVLFTRKFFRALLALRGDTGARSLLRTYPEDVGAIPLPNLRDLDTPADYADHLNRPPPKNSGG